MTPEHRVLLHHACTARTLKLYVGSGPKMHQVDAIAPADVAGEALEEALLQAAVAKLDELVQQLRAPS